MNTRKFLIAASIVLFTAVGLAGNAHATKWRTEKFTSFKGDKEVWQIKSIRNADLIIDEREKLVVLIVESGVLNHIDGIKLNGVLYDVTGESDRGDGWKSIILRSRVDGEFDLVEQIRKAKTIELNVYWHRNRNQVMKF